MAAAQALRVDAVGVQYGSLRALDGVSWSVRSGEILGIIGPNGAGKSTCLAAVTNSVRHSGRIELDGRDVTRASTHQLARLGLRRTYQQNAFFNDLSVLDNARCALSRQHGTPLWESVCAPWREWRHRRSSIGAATALLDRFGIDRAYFDLPPPHIPYGTQRMLSVAIAYAHNARVLLLDEPAAGTGGEDMRRLADLLVRMRAEGLALVVIEHHMDLIMSVADRIVVLDRGKLLATGTPDQVRNDQKVREAYLGRAS